MKRHKWRLQKTVAFKALALLWLTLEISGCASLGKTWKNFVGGKPDAPQAAASAPVSPQGKQPRGMRFSQIKDVPIEDGGRQYKRMTKEMFEEQAKLEDRAGSLWVPDGQSSYLFSQNMLRLVGDNLNIKLDGDARKALEAKTEVIKKLMKKAKKDEIRRTVAVADNGEPKKEGDGEKKDEKPTGKDKKNAGAKKEDDEDKEDMESTFGVNSVPARILEHLPDGNYRVRGVQSFMIGKNEYRVIAVGVVKPGDIKDDHVDASRMADSKFDIVSVKKDLKL